MLGQTTWTGLENHTAGRSKNDFHREDWEEEQYEWLINQKMK